MEKEKIRQCACGGRGRVVIGEAGFSVRCEMDPGVVEVQQYKTEARAVRAWNERQEDMDSLDRAAVTAYHRGTSYGKLVADGMAPPPLETKKPFQPKPKMEEGVELRCLHCGMIIPADCRSNRYCSPTCAQAYRDARRRLLEKQKRMERPKPVNKCVLCGEPIDPQSGRIKYCGEVCAGAAQRMRVLEDGKRRRAIKAAEKKIAGKPPKAAGRPGKR